MLWPDLSASALAALGSAAFVAGAIDALVGGGGLVLIPVLLLVLPGLGPAALLGTNKCAAMCGTFAAAVTYGRHVPPQLHTVRPMAIAAFAGSVGGAATVSQLSPAALRPLAAACCWWWASTRRFAGTSGRSSRSGSPTGGRCSPQRPAER